MMTRCLLLLAWCAAVTACSGRQSQPGVAAPDGSAIVVRGEDMSPGNVLESLRTRVPTMTVSLRSGECPRITFRGQRSLRNPGNPGIYVDGTQMLDTCVLTQISTADVDFVEISPSGNTSRPGYQRNGFGLIIIFRRRG